MDTRETLQQSIDQLERLVAGTNRGPDGANVVEHAVDRAASERHDGGRRRQLGGQRPHVALAHRAHIAERLRHDDVGTE